jgi:D-sedoheptulose 7-phosphate isomerase
MYPLQKYLTELQVVLAELPLDKIREVIDTLNEARFSGQHIFTLGNGGSASTASHFVCDLGKNARQPGLPPFKVIGLADNIAALSAYANDEGYEVIFARQLSSLVAPGDVVIGISTSGRSPNVLAAMQVAREAGAKTIGFTGFDGGALGQMVDIHVNVPSDCVEQIEDVHLMLEHLITVTLRDELGQKAAAELLYQKIERDLAGQLDQRATFRLLLQRSLDRIGASSGSLLVIDEKGDVSEGIMAYSGKLEPMASQEYAEICERGLARWVIENRRAALVPNTREDPRWLRRKWEDTSSRSAISIPLVYNGHLIGVLTLVHSRAGQFTNDDLGDLQRMIELEVTPFFVTALTNV